MSEPQYVRCLTGSYEDLTEGKDYLVLSRERRNDQDYYKILNNNGITIHALARLFGQVEYATMQSFLPRTVEEVGQPIEYVRLVGTLPGFSKDNAYRVIRQAGDIPSGSARRLDEPRLSDTFLFLTDDNGQTVWVPARLFYPTRRQPVEYVRLVDGSNLEHSDLRVGECYRVLRRTPEGDELMIQWGDKPEQVALVRSSRFVPATREEAESCKN